ncbi:MAG: hydantoinase/oxoprolinase family protein [Chloroflexota bacterium]|nr:hydantoinase/oxoprolinase family protein [Chloroflexota bacterium]
MAYKIGIDVGGTFTDFVARNGGQFFKGKVLSTPQDEAEGVLQAVDSIAAHYRHSTSDLLAKTDYIVLGTTVVTNMMLEYNGVKAGLITTKGFRDVIEIRRGYKESLFDIRLPGPYQIIPRQHRLGVTERIDYSGAVVTPLDEDEAREAVRRLKSAGVESIAVCFLFSFVNPAHEQRVREIIHEEYPDCFVTLSSEVLPQIREFERVSTTMVNAYTSPKLARYLDRLQNRLREKGFEGAFLVMQSNGGVMDVAYSQSHGVDGVLSGPAGGVVAAVKMGELSGYRNIITADMGGTSYDVCLVHEGQPEVGVDHWVSRYRIAVPLLDIHSIGAGGGSIAWVDRGGALRVGPQSARALPGPVCYGRGGTEPTVTDANLVLGYMAPEWFLGGAMELDPDAAARAIEEKVAQPLGVDMITAANGIFRIANNNLSNAVRYVSISRGRDPRDYALMAFGGAGAIHAGLQARDLGIKTILVPRTASVLSALGAVISDFKVSRIQSYVRSSANIDNDELNRVYGSMLDEAEGLLSEHKGIHEITLARYIDMRYEGQVQEVIVPLRSRTRRVSEVNLARALREFHDLHEKLYAFKRPDQPVEIVSLRVEVRGIREPVAFEARSFGKEDPSGALVGSRSVFFDGEGFVDTRIYDGRKIEPGNLISGPAIVHEPDTTIVIYRGQEAVLDQYDTYVIEIVE